MRIISSRYFLFCSFLKLHVCFPGLCLSSSGYRQCWLCFAPSSLHDHCSSVSCLLAPSGEIQTGACGAILGWAGKPKVDGIDISPRVSESHAFARLHIFTAPSTAVPSAVCSRNATRGVLWWSKPERVQKWRTSKDPAGVRSSHFIMYIWSRSGLLVFS